MKIKANKIDKNVISTYTLDQYIKKFKNRKHRLLKFSKKEVEDFDKQYGHYNYQKKTINLKDNYYLLKGRKWACINDTYYEIPKPIRFTWFRNLNAGIQALSCLLGAGVIAGVIAPTTIVLTRQTSKEEEKKEEEIKIIETQGYKLEVNIKTKECKIVNATAEAIVDGHIPSQIDGYNVTTIGSNAFKELNTIRVFTFPNPNTITKIEPDAFNDDYLEKIYFSGQVITFTNGESEYTTDKDANEDAYYMLCNRGKNASNILKLLKKGSITVK